MEKTMELLSRLAFGSGALALMGMSFALVVLAIIEVFAATSLRASSEAILAATGSIVIAMAVFDVAKYFVEEEVIRRRQLRGAGEARRSLTKFLSTISIAIFIEGLVTVFRFSRDEIDKMIYPTGLLLIGILIVVGLGVYQRLSAEVERQVGDEEVKRGGRKS